MALDNLLSFSKQILKKVISNVKSQKHAHAINKDWFLGHACKN